MNRVVVAMVLLAPFACGSNTSGNGAPDSSGPPKCGDGVCDITEINSCSADCGTRSGSNPGGPCNNDGVCESANGETSANCPGDCAGPPPPPPMDGGMPAGPSCLTNEDCTMAGQCCFFFTCMNGVGSDPFCVPTP
jgi:hypothetical protein